MICFHLPPSGNSVPIPRLLSGRAAHDGARGFTPALAARIGVPANRLLLTDSGSAALYVLLRGLARLEPRRRAVAIPAWCCPSVAQAAIQAGLEPVPVDLDPSTLGYEPSALREARSRGLLAVILVHYFGLRQPLPAGDWDGTAFIRDCAQDFDHRPDDGLPCFYSFGRGKALNAGHGGALCIPAGPSDWSGAPAPADDPVRRGGETAASMNGDLLRACIMELAALPESAADPRRMAVAINLLSQPHLYWAVTRVPGLGLGRTVWHPLRPERISPRFGNVGMASMEAYASCRGFYRRLVNAYRGIFSACDGDWAAFPDPPEADGDRLPARFPVLVREPRLREALIRDLGGRFGGVTRMYPTVIGELPGAPEGMSMGAGFPGSRRVARELLSFPVTAELRPVARQFLECLAGILRREGALRPGGPARRRRVVPIPTPQAAAARPEDSSLSPVAAMPGEAASGESADWSAVPAPREEGPEGRAQD